MTTQPTGPDVPNITQAVALKIGQDFIDMATLRAELDVERAKVTRLEQENAGLQEKLQAATAH